MSKTFGQLKANDEVYIIKGSNVEIAKVLVAEDGKFTWVTFGGIGRKIPSDLIAYHNPILGDMYCDIDEAIKKMKSILERALHNYRCASGALNLLETKKKMI